MFETAAVIGGLDLQVVYYRGSAECVASRWCADAKSLATVMSRIVCAAGPTQIGKVLAHARRENSRRRINAMVLISDACEEPPCELYAQARQLEDVPVFLFQEGSDENVSRIYTEIGVVTGGAFCRFDAGATERLANLLKAIAVFAAGGIKALAAQNNAAATLLLAQIKEGR
jgi:hypothetical protein